MSVKDFVCKTLEAIGGWELMADLCLAADSAMGDGKRVDQVERDLFKQLLGLGRAFLAHAIEKEGNGDEGAGISINGRDLRRSRELHAKTYHSIFGKISILRYVYAKREGQGAEYVPLDARLSLPRLETSYPLQDWQQRFVIKGPYAEATQSLLDLLGLKTSVNVAERINKAMGDAVSSFQASLPRPKPDTESEIIVTTADGKGVPMRQSLKERKKQELGLKDYPWKSRLDYQKTDKRRGAGDRKSTKQMAYAGAVYTIDPFYRDSSSIVDELARKKSQQQRPKPSNKRLFVEMTQIKEGEVLEGPQTLFEKLAKDVRERNPENKKTVICLMDGQRSLWAMQEAFLSKAICILDLMHVMERLWKAAHCLHPQTSIAAEAFVQKYLRMMLEGKLGYVIGAFKRKKATLSKEKERQLENVINYFETNRQYMKYDEHLANGYPIASGIIEGACRHMVKDRMELSGMRWEIEGAQSVLSLRAIYLNGDWDAFIEHHIQQEQTALYGIAA